MKTVEKVVFSGRIIELRLESARLPNGVWTDLEVIHHPGGAAAVAVDVDNNVCLLRQYRHVVRDWLWELPAGKRSPDEDPRHTAERELAEEARLTAGRWQALGEVISSPGVFTEVVHLFLAQDLEPTKGSPDPDEVFEIHWVPMKMALEWAGNGEIRDAKTLIGLYRAADRLRI